VSVIVGQVVLDLVSPVRAGSLNHRVDILVRRVATALIACRENEATALGRIVDGLPTRGSEVIN
jgi:hypothetical protein